MKEFFLLSEPNLVYVVLGTMLLAAGAGVVGCFTVLRKRALVSDAVAHSVLPGICVAFMLAQTKNTAVLMVGAVVAGWLSLLLTDAIVKHSKTKPDAAIGIVLSLFFGLGILLLTAIQQTGNAAQSGLDKYLFGKAASLTEQDVYIFGGVSLFLIAAVVVFYTPLKLFSFDPAYSQTRGLPTRFLDFLLSTLTVLAVSVGIQGVGVVLMASLLIAPCVAAGFFSTNLKTILVLAGFIAAAAAWLGCLISYLLPAMPTGPCIVVFLCFFVFFAVIFAPERGLLVKMLLAKKRHTKIICENILKSFYHLSEQKNSAVVAQSETMLLQKFSHTELKLGLKTLQKKGLLNQQNHEYYLTEIGTIEAKRIARLHRLWEMYLYKKLHMPADHVHANAEELEHFITPELEAQLDQELNYPSNDPHNKPIPR